MVSDLAIYQIARLLIDQHGGDGAKLLAVQRADEMLARGNLEGWQKWRRILLAVVELSSIGRPPGGDAPRL